MRGKVLKTVYAVNAPGITPACAGKSPGIPGCGRGHGDHPRVCGEKFGAVLSPDFSMGSPPRVRGKVGHAVVVPRPVGITPACAGKRRTADRRRHRRGDHPRVCGEKWSMMVPQTLTRGSPPRVRGKGMSNGCVLLCRGITPACAGKSLQQARRRSAAGDHPRVCGEKTLYSGIRRVVLGSPPRVRGKARRRP